MKTILHKVFQFYSFLRLVSLDIVLGVVSGAYFASRIFNVSPSVYFWITLVSAVWVIYTFDHILDGIRSKDKTINKTYIFHFSYRFQLMSVIAVVAGFATICVLFFLEKELIMFGVSTFVLVAIYLLLNYALHEKRRFFPKELIISILYTWGVFGGCLILNDHVSMFEGLVIINYFLIVFGNVLLFSLFDSVEDGINKFNTLTVNFGTTFTKKLILVTLTTAFFFSMFIGLYYSQWLVSFILAIMNLTLLLTILFPTFFSKNGYYRIIADAIFFLPAIVFWYNHF